jgi:hypothetical protein
MRKTSIQLLNDKVPAELIMSGPLNEQSSTELLPVVDGIKDFCKIRLGEVSSINSLGTMAWVRFITLLGQKCSKIELFECSIDFVSQANMILGFCGLARVMSFYGLYYCTQCPHEHTKLFESQELLTKQEDLETMLNKGIVCVKCGNSMELGEDSKIFIQRQISTQLQHKKAS